VILWAPMTKRKPSAADEDMATASIVEYFASVPDPRVERSQLHPLASVLVLSLCAVVSGANSFVGIEYFGKAREAWLRTFLDLPNGIPSHDTLGRIFAMLDPQALERAFREWVAAIATLTKGEVVAIDGKTLRRSFQKAGSGAFVHMVSAWAAGNQMVLGQVKTDEKSNEITAIPRLLELLQLTGCLVTIDAMGCQKDIAKKIVDSKADYMLAVKDNQPTLAAAVAAVFEEAIHDPEFAETHHQTESRGHGRTEIRRCWTLGIDAECGSPFDQWTKLKGIVCVESERTVAGKTSIERRHYITSRSNFSPKSALAASRSHWGIENQLHWVLDVAFREDDCRVRAGNAGENFAVIRHIAVNLLKAVQGGLKKNGKLGVQNKRLLAGWDDSYLLRVLGVPS
jgi:predicted transposase YbfD/YdcC